MKTSSTTVPDESSSSFRGFRRRSETKQASQNPFVPVYDNVDRWLNANTMRGHSKTSRRLYGTMCSNERFTYDEPPSRNKVLTPL